MQFRRFRLYLVCVFESVHVVVTALIACHQTVTRLDFLHQGCNHPSLSKSHSLPCMSEGANAQRRAAAILEDGVDVPGGAGRVAFETFESNVLFVLRFMIDCGVVGGCWVSAPEGKYELGGTPDRAMLSTCQIDVHLNFQCEPHGLVCLAMCKMECSGCHVLSNHAVCGQPALGG